MADVHGSTVTASVLALPDFFTSHASTERVLTSVLEDTRGARGEEIRQGQRQGRMADNSVDMGADMGAVAPSHAWERCAPDPAPMPWERRSHVHGSTAPMHGRGAPMRVERCSHEYGTLCSHDGSIAPMPMGGGAPMHGRGCSHDMGAGRNFWVSCLAVEARDGRNLPRPLRVKCLPSRLAHKRGPTHRLDSVI